MRIYILLLALVTLSCNSNGGKKVDDTIAIKEESSVVAANDIPADINTEEFYEIGDEDYDYEGELEEFDEESVLFSRYGVDVLENFTKAPLDFEDNEAAWMFRTRIREAYKSDKIDFAGYYIGVLFGCGSGCISGFIVDTRDGKIYALPLGEGNMCFYDIDKAVCKPDSRLFISSICRETGDGEIYYIAYLWDEESKEFTTIEKEDFLEQ